MVYILPFLFQSGNFYQRGYPVYSKLIIGNKLVWINYVSLRPLLLCEMLPGSSEDVANVPAQKNDSTLQAAWEVA